MSRLNATIKLLFACGELLFVIVSFLCVLSAAMVTSGNFFPFPLARNTAIIVLLISVAALVCSCFGCCAALRQTKRRGCCSGRRMLCLHQLLLAGVFFFGIVQLKFLETQQLRMAAIIKDSYSYPEYNAFERHVATFVNFVYFESFHSDSLEDYATTDWVSKLVQNKCPKRMSHEFCSGSEKRAICDFSSKLCCPTESLCESGVKDACPYEMCRKEILEQLHDLFSPMRIGAVFVCVLSMMMLVLSCLLICFNKRDEIEVELLKTGNISEEDIDAIRRLKSNKTRDNTIDFEQLENWKAPRPRFGSRKRHMKVSPSLSGTEIA
jgi:hypothetical protein